MATVQTGSERFSQLDNDRNEIPNAKLYVHDARPLLVSHWEPKWVDCEVCAGVHEKIEMSQSNVWYLKKHISRVCGESPPLNQLEPVFGILSHLMNLINCAKFNLALSKGFGLRTSEKRMFPFEIEVALTAV